MKINKSPVLTCVNYGINDFEFEQKIEYVSQKFNDFDIKNAKNCKFNTNFDVLSPDFLVKQNQNFSASLVVTKSQDEPVVLELNLDNNSILANYINITVENNVCAKVILKYISTQKSYCNSLVNINVTENANLDFTIVYDIGRQSINFVKLNNLVQKNAKLDYHIVDFCSLHCVQNFASKIEENASCNLKSICIAGGNSKVDINYIQNIIGSKACANIDCTSALKMNASKNFKGTINFEKGAVKSVGKENETCLLLSNTAKSKALPMLLCGEEDVDGSHSSSVGKIGDKELFYMSSRGIDKKEAVKIFVKAKFNNLLKDLHPCLKEEIISKIDKELDYEC